MRVHALVVAVVTGQCALEGAEEVRVGLPGNGDRVADDVAGDVHVRVDLLQRVQSQLHAFLHRVREHLQRVAHPGIGQADHTGLVVAVVEQVGAAGETVGERHAQGVAAGFRILVLPEGAVDHHEGLGRLHVAGAVQGHPHLLREQRFLALDLGGQQPALAGGEHRRVVAGVTPVVGHGDAAIGGAGDAFHAGAGGAVVQGRQAGARRPVRAFLGSVAPDAHGHLLHAADDQVLVVVAGGHHHAEDFQHRVGEVRVPAAGAEAHLAEHFAVVEGQLGEGLGAGHEVVEGAVIPQRNQGVPQVFQALHVAVADGLLDVAEVGTVFQRIGPGIGHFLEQRRQVGHLLGVVGLAFDIDDRAARGRRQRVGEGAGLEAEHVHVVVEGGGGGREAHAAQLGDDAVGAFEGLRAQTPAHLGGFVHHGFEAQLHQLVGRYQAGDTGPDYGHLGAMMLGGNAAQAGRMLDPVIEGEGEVRAKNGDGFLAVGGVAIVVVHAGP
ncbi:hypothetical protein D9M71_110580 [compost metagenome]